MCREVTIRNAVNGLILMVPDLVSDRREVVCTNFDEAVTVIAKWLGTGVFGCVVPELKVGDTITTVIHKDEEGAH